MLFKNMFLKYILKKNGQKYTSKKFILESILAKYLKKYIFFIFENVYFCHMGIINHVDFLF